MGRENIDSCWLPTDVHYPGHELTEALARLDVTTRYLPLPIFRRDYLTALGILGLIRRRREIAHTSRPLLSSKVTAAYLATSATLAMAPIFKRNGLFVVAHIHETWGMLERRLLTPFLRSTDRIIAVSRAVARRIPRLSQIVYNGFPDIVPHAPSPPCGSDIQFLLASRWSTWKGHAELLRAWAAADTHGKKLTILGGPPKSGTGIDVRALVASLRIGDSVDIVGEVSNVNEYLAKCNVVLVPSTKPDPLPTIAIEAARAGRAVIASNIGGIPEIVEHGHTGWLLDPRSQPEWMNAISSLRVDKLESMGAAARDVYCSRFSVGRFEDELRSALR